MGLAESTAIIPQELSLFRHIFLPHGRVHHLINSAEVKGVHILKGLSLTSPALSIESITCDLAETPLEWRFGANCLLIVKEL